MSPRILIDRTTAEIPYRKWRIIESSLFGSQADGTAGRDSDVDLPVVTETDLPPLKRYPAVRKELYDFPFAFDIITKTPEEYDAQKGILNHIVYFAEKYGRVVYEG